MQLLWLKPWVLLSKYLEIPKILWGPVGFAFNQV